MISLTIALPHLFPCSLIPNPVEMIEPASVARYRDNTKPEQETKTGVAVNTTEKRCDQQDNQKSQQQNERNGLPP